MQLTRDHVAAAKSKSGGWTKKQLAAIGVSWPPAKGWADKVCGKEVSADALRQFLEGKR